VAALELLAGAAPARVVAPELLLLRLDHGPRRDRAASGPDRRRRTAGRRDRLGAGERLVLVGEVAVPAGAVRARPRHRPAAVARPALARVRRGRLDLSVEEERDQLLPDRGAQLLEQ